MTEPAGLEQRLAEAESNLDALRRGEADAVVVGDHVRLLRQAESLARESAERELLVEADRRKNEFIAMLAHELRNPLAPLRSGLDVLKAKGAGDPELLAMMTRQVDHLVRLVEDLMDVSRIGQGKIALRREPLDLAAAVRDAVEACRPLIEEREHRLVVEVPGAPFPVQGDAARLVQVVSNLVNNAARYTPAGGRIWVALRRDGDEAVVSVRDDGAGLPRAELARIFDRFVQLERPSGRAVGGMGIGLSLVKSLVELHGGSVGAESDGPGRGSEFVVRLPLAASAGPLATPAAPPVPGSAPVVARRILVVDDSLDAAESTAMLLELLGAETQVACCGRDALEALGAFSPSVVLLDISMPDMDGYEVARLIRRHPGAERTTLIALTGWGHDDDRRRALEAGFDHHLVKPVSLEELQALLAGLAPA